MKNNAISFHKEYIKAIHAIYNNKDKYYHVFAFSYITVIFNCDQSRKWSTATYYVRKKKLPCVLFFKFFLKPFF